MVVNMISVDSLVLKFHVGNIKNCIFRFFRMSGKRTYLCDRGTCTQDIQDKDRRENRSNRYTVKVLTRHQI